MEASIGEPPCRSRMKSVKSRPRLRMAWVFPSDTPSDLLMLRNTKNIHSLYLRLAADSKRALKNVVLKRMHGTLVLEVVFGSAVGFQRSKRKDNTRGRNGSFAVLLVEVPMLNTSQQRVTRVKTGGGGTGM